MPGTRGRWTITYVRGGGWATEFSIIPAAIPDERGWGGTISCARERGSDKLGEARGSEAAILWPQGRRAGRPHTSKRSQRTEITEELLHYCRLRCEARWTGWRRFERRRGTMHQRSRALSARRPADSMPRRRVHSRRWRIHCGRGRIQSARGRVQSGRGQSWRWSVRSLRGHGQSSHAAQSSCAGRI